MPYNVYRVEYLGSPNHVAIFVDTGENDGGKIFNVIGNILIGMTYQAKLSNRPILSDTFVAGSEQLVGQVEMSNMARFEAISEAIDPPGAQLELSGRRKDPSKPLERCGEWVEKVVQALRAEGILFQ